VPPRGIQPPTPTPAPKPAPVQKPAQVNKPAQPKAATEGFNIGDLAGFDELPPVS
jgi:hypothetical protein